MKRKLFPLCLTVLLLLVSRLTYGQNEAFVESSYNHLSNGTIELLFDVEIQSGWYMYAATEVPNGPMATNFDITPNESFELVGKTVDAKKSKKKFDEAFSMDVFVFENNGYFKQIIRPLTDKPFSISGTLVFQTCSGMECIINDSDITFSIKPNKETKQTK